MVKQLNSWLGIASSELLREVKTLKSEEASRLMHVCSLAEQLFHGDLQEARQWMQSPAYAFRGEIPLEHARTEQGAQEVETLIGRMKYGLPI
jgi:putative toxin-antitoxin system antitoxin component (TIGR02293 family)